MTELNHEDRVILFLDFMGFKEIVNNTVLDPGVLAPFRKPSTA